MCICCCAAVLAAAQPTRARGAEGGQNWALLIGIDKYQRPEVPALVGAANDARALRDALIQYGGVAAEHVFVLTSDASDPNSLPTRNNIAFRLGWLSQQVRPGDSLIVFYSGHGFQRGVAGQAYLLTYEADVRNDVTTGMTCLSAADLRQALQAIPASRLLLLLDACRSDPTAAKDVERPNALSDGFARAVKVVPRGGGAEQEVAATVYACRVGERAYEWPAEKQGFFAYYLVQGLSGAAADAEGQVTLSSLITYLETNVPAKTEEVLGKRQVPWQEIEGVGTGGWVLARVIPRAPETAVRELPTAATLKVSSDPAGATVTVDGQARGISPCELTIDLGPAAEREVEVALQMPGYLSRGSKITLRRGAIARWEGVHLAAVSGEVPEVHKTQGMLGTLVMDLPDSLKTASKAAHGVFVWAVEPGSPADRAGVRAEDVITEFQGDTITTTEQFVSLVRATVPGTTAELRVQRAGSSLTMNAVVEAFGVSPSAGSGSQAARELVVGRGAHYSTIDAALAAAEDGDTIHIQGGRYPGPVAIFKNVLVRGESKDSTFLECSSLVPAILADARGLGEVSGMTITQRGDGAGIYIRGGSFNVKDCEISAGGPCIAVGGDYCGRITDCAIRGSSKSAGIYVMSDANPQVVSNLISGNNTNGIYIAGKATGRYHDNTISGNGLSGIAVSDEANPEMVGNQVADNKEAGVLIWGKATGRYYGNAVSDNRLGGILVKGDADPLVQGNAVTENRQAGIWVYGNATGTYKQNRIFKYHGEPIRVTEGAKPTLIDNRIE